MNELLARLIERPVGASFHLGEYRVSRSASASEDQEIFKFRYQEYSKSGFLRPEAYSNGLLKDEFDRASVLITVRNAMQTIVGTARFVRPSIHGFHTESLFDFDLCGVLRSRMGEFGRLAVSSDHRGGGRIAVVAILKAVFECMMESGTTHVLAFLPPRLADSFSALGCKSATIQLSDLSERSIRNRAPMQPYFEKHPASPVLYDLEEMLSNVGVVRDLVAHRIRL